MKNSVNQLIKYFKPEGYMLSLDARPGSRDFSGQVFIQGNKIGDFVRLHAKGLTFDSVIVNAEPAEVIALDNDEVELRPAENKPLSDENKADIRKHWNADCDTSVAIKFHGRISDNDMHGLYPCYYELDGEKKELLATQFESHHAREVFPCVDEPAAKAKFTCQVNTAPDSQALGNMPIESNEIVADETRPSRRVVFETTPKMSTYLLAFVIGDLQRKTAKTKSGVEVNIYATPAQEADSLDFALDTAVKCIDFYDDYFGVKYPLPKSDHVALPDFSSGAMENWGLITYRETALLAGQNSGIISKQYIATVIAHELSHQWFGNLVTMQWWNDLWLNESFASLMEHIATDALFPDWNMWQTFETSDVVAALRRDSLPGVQPVRQDVQHPDEISTLFDSAIVYAKGERLLKMLRAFIGEDNFRAGLTAYFEKFAYSNTTAEDLWNCLGKAADYDVASLMNPWLMHSGYPVVKARLVDNELQLSQQRFYSDGSDDSEGYNWPIPLFANNSEVPKIMDESEITIKPSNPNDLILNVGNNSHFITAYDETLAHNLASAVSDMQAVDRAKALNEALILAQPGLMSMASLIDLLQSYSHEDNDAVWDVMAMAIGALQRFVELDSNDEKILREFSGDLARAQYSRLGWHAGTDEGINDRRLRPTVTSEMIFARDRDAIDEALALYSDSKHNLSELDGDLRTIVLSVAVRYGSPEDFDYLVDQHKISQNADLKQDIASALTSTRDQSRIDQLLGFLDNGFIIKPQDLFYWYIWLLRNRHSREKTWSWLVAHWSWIEKTFSGDKSYDAFPRYAGQILDSSTDLEKYREFFSGHLGVPALKRAIEVGLNDISSRVAWIERDKAAVLARLLKLSKTS